MKRNLFLLTMLTLALATAGTTILYFAQMNRLYVYFDPDMVYLAIVSFAYLAQGAGMLGFMLLYKYRPAIFGRRFVLTGVMIAFIPILIATMLIPSGAILMVLLIMTNILIGYVLGNCFTNIAAFAESAHVGLCWGAAYAIGNILSWLASQIDASFMTSLKVTPIVCVVIGITIIPIMLSQDLPVETAPDIDTAKKDMRQYLWILLAILLMTLIYTIGSTDYSMVAEKIVTSSTFYTRCIYAAGLLIAGLIYDKSHNVSAVCALTSIIYPIMAAILLKIEFQINMIYCLSFFFLGFLAVYRACIFISAGSENKKYLYLAGLGLLVSRFTEGIFALVNAFIARTEVVGFIVCGVMFVPLIIVFCMMVLEQNQKVPSEEEKLSAFSTAHNLTRREEEIVTLLLKGLTNGEIAEALTISEGTARFHVSNVLKKTGCKSRNDVIHVFHQI